jgi:flagellar motor switch protein FliM
VPNQRRPGRHVAGISFSYSVISPIATEIKIVREKQMRLYIVVKQTLLGFMNGAMPQVALEHGRKPSPPTSQTIDEVEQETLASGGSDTGGGAQGGLKRHVGAANVQPPNIQSLFGGASASVERVPMLRLVFERAAACAGLRSLTSTPPFFTVESVETGTAAEMFAQHDGAIVAAALQAPGWNTKLLISARRSAVFAIVEAMLGGDGSQAAYAGKRSFSKIETRIAAAFFVRFARALSASVAPVAATQFALEAPANSIDFDLVGGRNTAVFAVKLNLDILGRGGRSSSPSRKLRSAPCARPSRAQAARAGARSLVERSSADRARQRHLERRARQRPMRLGDIANFRVGQVVELKATPRTRVHLECDGQRMVVCQFGKSNGVYTLRVDDFIDREQEFMNDILSG